LRFSIHYVAGQEFALSKMGWYISRLQQMQPAEVLWRAGSLARLPVDYLKMKLAGSIDRYQPIGEWWKANHYPIKAHRDGKASNLIRLFDVTLPADLVIDWHYDYRHEKSAPRQFSRSLDIRNPAAVGDIKYIWELSRHQYLTALAYSNHPEAEAIVWSALRSWINENPYLTGVNWSSSLELASRLISWSFLYPMLRPAFETDREFRERFAASVFLHLSTIRKNLSLHSSANNHLLGELTGLYVGSVCFAWWPECREWRNDSLRLLGREVELQFTPEGVNREQAMSYQLFTLELLMLAMLVARNVGDIVAPIWNERILAALHYLDRVATPGGALPWFGDSDDARGFLVSEGEQPLDVVMQLGALIFEEPRFANRSPHLTAASRALVPASCGRLSDLAEAKTDIEPRSELFRHGGIAVIEAADCKVVMDVGPLGYTSIAAHGHSDALSLLLALDNDYLIVDCGTYSYHSHPVWRTYFRGTAAHNTVRVDGVDQSVMSGRFLWSSKANVRLIHFVEEGDVVRISAEHDGYLRLSDPVMHRRNVSFDKKIRTVSIEDVITCKTDHKVEVHWHLSEQADVTKESDQCVRVLANGQTATLTFDRQDFDLEIISGATQPILGWRSPAFNQKVHIPTIRFAGQVVGSTSIFTSIHLT
jgi:hypothetical protein